MAKNTVYVILFSPGQFSEHTLSHTLCKMHRKRKTAIMECLASTQRNTEGKTWLREERNPKHSAHAYSICRQTHIHAQVQICILCTQEHDPACDARWNVRRSFAGKRGGRKLGGRIKGLLSVPVAYWCWALSQAEESKCEFRKDDHTWCRRRFSCLREHSRQMRMRVHPTTHEESLGLGIASLKLRTGTHFTLFRGHTAKWEFLEMQERNGRLRLVLPALAAGPRMVYVEPEGGALFSLRCV